MSAANKPNVGRILLAVGAVLLVLFLGYQFIVAPLESYNTQIASLNKEIADKHADVGTIRKEKPLLDRWKQESLPVDKTDASSGYQHYLDKLIDPNKVAVGPQHLVIEAPADFRAGGPAGAARKPVYTSLVAYRDLRTNLAGLTTLLKRIQDTPLVQKIKTLKIEPAKDGSLKIHLVLEALVIEGADREQPNLVGVNGRLIQLDVLNALARGPAWLSLLSRAVPSRNYGDIVRKNIFTGPLPPVVAKKEPPKKLGQDIRSYIRLTMIRSDSVKEEAILLDRFNNHKKIVVGNAPGKKVFRIQDSDGADVARAEFVKMGPRDLYYRIDKGGRGIRPGIYGLEIGQSLLEARPIDGKEAMKLGIPMSALEKKASKISGGR
jgi:hypothetical protein